MKRFLEYVLAGHPLDGLTRQGDHHCFWWGWWINLKSRRGRCFHWLLELRWTLRCLPVRGRNWLANQRMKMAMRLRGDAVSTFGFYDELRGNEAARLAESLRSELAFQDDAEKREAMAADLQRLASLAHATWHTISPEPTR